ncbi:MAG: DUF1667 domain-containing protein [Bacilli bacterium]|nr:DUF1667 domain-containing protein [Bacilli bacterium]MBN2696884.1 DUF1667 domain-containing protein [Bacilli bacterium]
MRESQKLTCINCPMGCELEVSFTDSGEIIVSGYKCLKGLDYAKKEVMNPTRTITSSVPVVDGEMAMVSIRTDRDVPKKLIRDCMMLLKDMKVNAPISAGDIIIENICGTGVNFIATRSVRKK